MDLNFLCCWIRQISWIYVIIEVFLPILAIRLLGCVHPALFVEIVIKNLQDRSQIALPLAI